MMKRKRTESIDEGRESKAEGVGWGGVGWGKIMKYEASSSNGLGSEGRMIRGEM